MSRPYFYLNLNFKTRDYETTNIVARRTNGAPPQDGGRWAEVSEAELSPNLTWLYIQGDAAYLGYL